MVKLEERLVVFNKCNALADVVHYFQKAMYDDLKESLSPEEFAEFRLDIDDIDVSKFSLKYTGQFVYKISTGSIKHYLELLPQCLIGLSMSMHWDELTFVLENNRPWQMQQNDYSYVKNALNYLRSKGVDENYRGAITVAGEDVPEMLLSVFWLGRCNASLPSIYITAPGSKVVLHICKYGLLHFDCYCENDMAALKKYLGCDKSKLDSQKCYEYLEDDGCITGREIIVD